MEYRVLGPLEAVGSDGPIPLGGAKQRAVLALLVLNANRVVSGERLIDELWGDDPPETASTGLQVYVSRLRKLLPEGSLQTRAPGYVLEADPECVDILRFERLLKDGRATLAAGDLVRGTELIGEGVALWRGPPLAEFAQSFARLEGGRLDDLRVAALEDRLDADLELGRHAEIVGELELLIAANPHRERLREQLMLALYRCGRQTDALEVYRDIRATLDELGIEPGERLRRLERQILSHDEELAAPAQSIRPDPEGTVGRERKCVTVLFASLATTNEAEEDPELTADLFERFEAEAAAEIERAGGMIEHGLVGAMLATFGAAPSDGTGHSAQAARAALAARDQLTRTFGDTLSLRLALESGDVVLGRPGSLAMGKPVAEAARLVGLAQPGDIVVGHRAGQELETDFELRERGSAHVLVAARAEPITREVRKTVTVLFADLVESTQLGHELEPEALSLLMSRYFERMEAAVVRHGGIVEKFIGDAVMAIFGVPVLHEDDPLRAVRAACEMRESLTALDEEFERVWGVHLRGRIGVNTGEVMAGDHVQGHLIVTGRAVTLAKRLEEAAETGEIMISEATHRLVRDAVAADPVSGREVKGGETLDGFVVREVQPHTPGRARRFDTPLVDREEEFAALLGAFQRVTEKRECHLLTLLGDAGVGKSRLVQEFATEVAADALVVYGRCLSYGDGITYWPLAEVVRDVVRSRVADAEPSQATIAAILEGDEKAALAAELIAEALGLGGSGGAVVEQSFWAFRKLFEALARHRPLVVVLDDLQWAESTLVELIDHVVDNTRGAPILLLCVARPDLLDSHPGWGGGKRHATTTSLEPLGDDDTRRLIGNLLGRGSLPTDVEGRIAATAEGNALFVEELLAMLVDERALEWDDGRWVVADDLAELTVPQEINAFLAARLEQLPPRERSVLVRASVEGAVFHTGALQELAPELSDASLADDLASLVRRDIIRPERSGFAGDEAYRFRHLLIRDAAYLSLAKSRRADLHERFAGWLERAAGSARMLEYEEIVGYHLEQAYRCRVGLRPPDELKDLGTRASERLGSAGHRALGRSDLPAAIGLLERAVELLPADEPWRRRLLSEVGEALIEAGRLADAEGVLAEARQLAANASDECAEAHALVQQQLLQLLRVETGSDAAMSAVEAVVPVFTECGDESGLCRARRLEAWLHWNEAHAAAAVEAWEEAAAHAMLAGDDHARVGILTWIASGVWFGPTPVADAIRRCEQIRNEVDGHIESEALTLRHLGGLHAMNGEFVLARSLIAKSDAVFDDLGPTLANAATSHVEAVADMLAGDPAAAEASLRSALAALERMGEQAFLSTTLAFLARAVLAQERHQEADELARRSADLTAPADTLTQILWRGVAARVLARRGQLGEAEPLAREAVELAERTDFLVQRGDAWIDLAQVLRGCGRMEDAAAAAAEGLHLHEQKRNVGTAAKIRTAPAV
jgi:predicted ATPase/class 3 adenylate cyclase